MVFSPEKQGKENDDENLLNQNIGLQDVTEHLEVLYHASQVGSQYKNI